MKFKAILFDFDGLMFDTEKVWKDYFIKANKIFNTNFTEEDRIQTIGRNEKEIRKKLKETNPSLDVDAYRDWMRENVHFHQKNKKVAAKKGLFDLLKHIKQNDMLSAIVSGSEKIIIENMLNKRNIKLSDFKVMITGDMKITPKPNPDVYLLACKSLGVEPKEAIVLEDSYNGVKAGKNAGCFTIMIPDTMPVNYEMKQTADLILNDLTEVVDFLQKN